MNRWEQAARTFLDEARAKIAAAQARKRGGDQSDAVEADARDALRLFRRAMDWTEEGPIFDDAHRELDAAGKFVRSNFPLGCRLQGGDTGYVQRCPAALAHLRVGMSIGGFIRASHCSICARSLDECDHVTGREYEGKTCARVITDFDLQEISLVDRPANPDCRLHAITVPLSDLVVDEARRDEIEWISCDRCLADCRGSRSWSR